MKKTTTKHEAAFLRLDNKLIKKVFDYKEIFKMEKTMEHSAKVYADMLAKNNIYMSITSIIDSIII